MNLPDENEASGTSSEIQTEPYPEVNNTLPDCPASGSATRFDIFEVSSTVGLVSCRDGYVFDFSVPKRFRECSLETTGIEANFTCSSECLKLLLLF